VIEKNYSISAAMRSFHIPLFFLLQNVMIFSLLNFASTEVFTATADVHHLVNTERRIIDVLRLLITAEKNRLSAIET
jgi:hypothetical protein